MVVWAAKKAEEAARYILNEPGSTPNEALG